MSGNALCLKWPCILLLRASWMRFALPWTADVVVVEKLGERAQSRMHTSSRGVWERYSRGFRLDDSAVVGEQERVSPEAMRAVGVMIGPHDRSLGVDAAGNDVVSSGKIHGEELRLRDA